jgi:hypothetical protein
MDSYGTIENKEDVSSNTTTTTTPSTKRRLVSIVAIALALAGVALLVKVNVPSNAASSNVTNLKIVKPVTTTTTTTTSDSRGSALRGSNYIETFNPTPILYPTAVRSLTPTKSPTEEVSKRTMKKVDTVDYAETRNPTSKLAYVLWRQLPKTYQREQ